MGHNLNVTTSGNKLISSTRFPRRIYLPETEKAGRVEVGTGNSDIVDLTEDTTPIR